MLDIPEKYKNNFLSNIDKIKTLDPALYENLIQSTAEQSLEIAQDGTLTIKLKGKWIESKFAPKTNALRFIQGEVGEDSPIFFLGCGLGYHINSLLERGNYRGILIEKDIDIFKASLYVLEPKFLVHVIPLIGLEKSVLAQRISELTPQEISIIKHTQSIRLYSDYYRGVEELVINQKREFVASSITEKESRRLWVRNIFHNLISERHRYYVTREFLRHFEGPVILVSSGPFIEDMVGRLKKLSHKLPLFSLLPSVPYLLKNGIRPDFIVTTDAGFGNRYRLITSFDIPLITTYSVDTSIIENWHGNVFLFSHGLPLEEKLFTVNRWSIRVPMQGTSSIVMIILARLMGFTEIYLAGYDFAYKGLKDHHRGAGFDSFFLINSSRLKNWHTMIVERLRKDVCIETRDQSGDYVYTSHKLMLYKKWLERGLLGEDLKRLNNGAYIEGISSASPSILYDYSVRIKSSFLESVNSLGNIKIREDQLFKDFDRLKERLAIVKDVYGRYEMFYGKGVEKERREDLVKDVDFAVKAFQKSYRILESK